MSSVPLHLCFNIFSQICPDGESNLFLDLFWVCYPATRSHGRRRVIAFLVGALELSQKSLSATWTFACRLTHMSNCYFWSRSTMRAQLRPSLYRTPSSLLPVRRLRLQKTQNSVPLPVLFRHESLNFDLWFWFSTLIRDRVDYVCFGNVMDFQRNR